MLKRLLLPAFAALTAIVIFSSCNKSNKEGRWVPATAAVVVHVNAESLGDKLPWSEIKKNSIFTKVAADTSIPAFGKALLDDPENSGIDIDKGLIGFYTADSINSYGALEGSIKDEGKFKALLANADKAGKEIKKGDVTYWSGNGTSVGYTKEKFVFTFDAETPKAAEIAPWSDTMAMDTLAMPMPPAEAVSAKRDMNPVSEMLFNLKEDASLAKNEKFSDLMSSKGDFHFWVNYENFMNMPQMNMAKMNPAMAMMNLDKAYKGLIYTGSISFEDGKILADSKTYAGKELNELYKKYEGKNIDKDLLAKLPGKDFAGVVAFNFKPEGLREFLKLLGMDGFANLGAGQLGFSLDDFVSANKGELIVSVSDLRKDTISGDKADFIFAAAINNKDAFAKLIAAGQKAGKGMSMNGGQLGYANNDQWFALSSNKQMADDFVAGRSKNSSEMFGKLANAPMSGFINIKYIIAQMGSEGFYDSTKKMMYDINKAMWDNVTFSGGNYSGGGITGKFELNLIDTKTNSLKQLNSFASRMHELDEAHKKSLGMYDEEVKVDTVTVIR